MISPVVENIQGRVSYGEAYHGYWSKDLYALNSHFGTHQDLLDLTGALHKRGMYIMLDTVINNMAYMTRGSNPATNVDYSVFTPFDSSDYFHPYCEITNPENYTLAQQCWIGDNIVALPDLKTNVQKVQNTLEKWIRQMISIYSIDGLRIDAAKHVTLSFLPSFADAAGIFVTGEVYEQSTDIICNYQRNYLPSTLNYPLYFAMLETFGHGNISALNHEVAVMRQHCPDTTALTTFSENHDVSRFASINDDMAVRTPTSQFIASRTHSQSQLAKNILTFTILYDGIPKIYQGQEQHFTGSGIPTNRKALWPSNYNTHAPLYRLTQTLNRIRQHAAQIDAAYIATKSYPLYSDKNVIVLRKGKDNRQVITVLSTQGSNTDKFVLTLPSTYGPDFVATDVLHCVNYTTDLRSEMRLVMEKGLPRVLYPADLMPGSGLCGYPRSNVSWVELTTGGSSVATGLLASHGLRGVLTLVCASVVSVLLLV